MDNLYRKESLEYRKSNIEGEVLVLPTISQSVLVIIITCLFISLMTFVSTTRVGSTETVRGWVSPTEREIKIYSKHDGIIFEIFAEEGQEIKEGDRLVKFVNSKNTEAGMNAEDKNIDIINNRIAILNSRKKLVKESFELRTAEITKRIKFLEQREMQNIDNSEILWKQSKILAEESNRLKKLESNGFVSKNSFEIANLEFLRSKAEISQSEMLRIDLLSQLESAKINLNEIKLESIINIDTINEELEELKYLLAQNLNSKESFLHSPISGILANVQAREGDSAITFDSKPMFSIYPENTKLNVVLLVPTKSIGFMSSGQKIKIRYNSFPYEQFGSFNGEISTVSTVPILPGELTNTSYLYEEPVYRVYADIELDYIYAFGKKINLKPGMTLEADVVLRERTILGWIFEPILRIGRKL